MALSISSLSISLVGNLFWNKYLAPYCLGHPTFFFRVASNAFPDIGSVGRIEKKTKKNHKKSRNKAKFRRRASAVPNLIVIRFDCSTAGKQL